MWLTQSDSVPPRLRYCACIISRSRSESSGLAGSGTVTSRHSRRLADVVGPVNVEPPALLVDVELPHLEGESVCDSLTRRFGRPAGGCRAAQVARKQTEEAVEPTSETTRAEGRARLEIGAVERPRLAPPVEARAAPEKSNMFAVM